MSNASNSPEITTASLGDVQPPAHLAQRLQDEQQRFGHSVSPDALNQDLAAHDERHQAFLQSKSQQGHAEVEHAKHIASTHTSDPSNEAPSRSRGPNDPRLDVAQELEQGVEQKRRSLERRQAEIDDMNEKLRRADEVERLLREKLGAAGAA
ncbi:hypothetical protein JCM8097_006458 [Rhodosporidiobolus ruineniae]